MEFWDLAVLASQHDLSAHNVSRGYWSYSTAYLHVVNLSVAFLDLGILLTLHLCPTVTRPCLPEIQFDHAVQDSRRSLPFAYLRCGKRRLHLVELSNLGLQANLEFLDSLRQGLGMYRRSRKIVIAVLDRFVEEAIGGIFTPILHGLQGPRV